MPGSMGLGTTIVVLHLSILTLYHQYSNKQIVWVVKELIYDSVVLLTWQIHIMYHYRVNRVFNILILMSWDYHTPISVTHFSRT